MAFNRGYQPSMGQPNPWASGAPPNQVMSGLMTTGYQTGPQNHFAPNPNTGYNLAGGSGINWNIQGQVPPNSLMKMGQQQSWNQGVAVGNQRMGNQRTPNKRNGNWNHDGNQVKRMNRGTPNNNNNNSGNNANRNNMIKNNQQPNRNQNMNNNNRGNMNNQNHNRNFNNRNNQNQNNNQNNNLKKRNQNQNNNRKCVLL